jgi:hypothetical protein
MADTLSCERCGTTVAGSAAVHARIDGIDFAFCDDSCNQQYAAGMDE